MGVTITRFGDGLCTYVWGIPERETGMFDTKTGSRKMLVCVTRKQKVCTLKHVLERGRAFMGR